MPTLFLAATLFLHAAAYWLWTRKLVPAEVALNDRDILANGSQDDLRKGYHQRRGWARFWQWLGLTVAGNLSLCFIRPTNLVFLVGCAALGILLASYFAARFTPLLNLARAASGRPDLSEYTASSDSASWPDAACWKQARLWPAPGADAAEVAANRQWYANQLLRKLLGRVAAWRWVGYGVLVVGAGWVAIKYL